MKVRLFCAALAGKSPAVGTSIGRVDFDKHGNAEVDAVAEDLPRYKSVGWFAEVLDDVGEKKADEKKAPKKEKG